MLWWKIPGLKYDAALGKWVVQSFLQLLNLFSDFGSCLLIGRCSSFTCSSTRVLDLGAYEGKLGLGLNAPLWFPWPQGSCILLWSPWPLNQRSEVLTCFASVVCITLLKMMERAGWTNLPFQVGLTELLSSCYCYIHVASWVESKLSLGNVPWWLMWSLSW